MEDIGFFNVLITVLSLVALAIPGFVLAKIKMFPEKASEAFSVLVLYCCQPMLMIMGFQKAPYRPEIGMNMLIVAGLALLIHGVMIALLLIVFRNKSKDKKIDCLRFASVFGNCGYMGLPFLQILFWNSAILGDILIYASVVIAIFNILTWSVGVYIISGDIKQMSFKRAFLNPTIIGVAIGLILFFAFRKPLTEVAEEGSALDTILSALMKSINFLAEMVTPLGMIVVGTKLANVNMKGLFLDKWAYVSSINKLLIMSVLTMLIVAFLPIDNAIKFTLFFALSMPSATNTVMFSVTFGGDADSASVMVLLSTIFSILTIPLMFLMFTGVFNVVI